MVLMFFCSNKDDSRRFCEFFQITDCFPFLYLDLTRGIAVSFFFFLNNLFHFGVFCFVQTMLISKDNHLKAACLWNHPRIDPLSCNAYCGQILLTTTEEAPYAANHQSQSSWHACFYTVTGGLDRVPCHCRFSYHWLQHLICLSRKVLPFLLVKWMTPCWHIRKSPRHVAYHGLFTQLRIPSSFPLGC